MHRKASLLFLGSFAAAAVAHGITGCSSDDSSAAPTTDSGTDTGTVGADSSTGSVCSGTLSALQVIVNTSTGEEGAPDLSCYLSGNTSLIKVLVNDDGGTDGSDDSGLVDAGTDTGTEADSGTDSSTPPTDAGTDSSTPPADAGGDASTPPTGTYQLQLLEFISHLPLPGTSVQLFFGSSTAGTPAFTGTTDDAGMFPFTPPVGATLLSYYASGTATSATGSTPLYPVHFYSQPIVAPDGGGIGTTYGYEISQSDDTDLAEAVLGSYPQDSTKGSIVAAARDCQGRDLQNAIFTLIDGATGQPITTDPSADGVKLVYFGAQGIPDTSCTHTTNVAQAVWAALNAPVNAGSGVAAHSYKLQLSGVIPGGDAGATAQVLDTIDLEIWANSGNVPRPFKLSSATSLP